MLYEMQKAILAILNLHITENGNVVEVMDPTARYEIIQRKYFFYVSHIIMRVFPAGRKGRFLLSPVKKEGVG